MECISCIKDATTGICRDIKDKTARELIAELQEKVNDLSGVSGDIATEEDIVTIQNQINSINEILEEVATNTELDTIQTQLDTLQTTLNNQVSEIITSLNAVITTINNLDNTYATDNDITNLQEQINTINEFNTIVNNHINNNLNRSYVSKQFSEKTITGKTLTQILSGTITTRMSRPLLFDLNVMAKIDVQMGYFDLHIDGTQVYRAYFDIHGDMSFKTFSAVLPPLTNGEHTYTLYASTQLDTSTITIDSYVKNTFTLLEL